MDFKKIFILILSTLFFSPLYSTAMDKTTSSTSKTAEKDKPAPEDECAICLSEFGDKPDFVKLQCKHFFHSYCINIWREKETWCPVCKQNPTCLCCHKQIENTDNYKGRPVITPCGHAFHLSCLMQYKDIGVYQCDLGCIGGHRRYCVLNRKNQCPVCNEYLSSKFLKKIKTKYNYYSAYDSDLDDSSSEDDSYDDE